MCAGHRGGRERKGRMDRVLSIPLGVVIAREKIDHPWQEYAWRPVSVFLNAPEASQWRELRREAKSVHYHAATLPLELHAKETIGYAANLETGEPTRLRRAARERATAARPMQVAVITASPYDAEVYGYDMGSEIVGTVAMPDAADRAAGGVRGRAPRRGAVRQAPAPEASPGRGAQVRPGAHRGAAPASRPAGRARNE